MHMLAVGPIPVGAPEAFEAPFTTSVDWVGVAIAAGAFVLAMLAAAILLVTAPRVPEAPVSVEYPKAA